MAYITVEEVKNGIEEAVDKLGLYFGDKEPKHKGLYSILSNRYPLFIDDAIPKATMEHIKQAHTCACADGNHIYLSSEALADMLNGAEAAGKEISRYKLAADVQDLVIHEYTHIIMEHLKKINRFQSQSGNANNVKTFSLACEIEANRGYNISLYSDIYKMGVTEQAFPEVNGVYGLHNIYEVLKKYYGNEIDEHMNKQKEDKKSTEEGEQEQQEQSGGKLSQEQKKLLDQYKEEFDQQEEEAKQLEKGNSECDGEGDSEGGGMSISGGGTGTSEGPSSPVEALRAYNKRHNQELLKADLSKLKGILSGADVSRGIEKTYSRPARRDSEAGLMKKGTKKGPHNAPRMLIGMDSSGSMSSTTMQQVLNTISDIIKVTGRSMKGSYICEHDCYVKNMSPLYEYKKVIAKYDPDGGNCFDELLRAGIEKNVQCIINVGDGWDYFNERTLMKQAKKLGIKWFDVIINDRVEKWEIEQIVERELKHFGEDDYIGRTVLKIK